MKYLEIFLLCALSSLAGYTICVWQPKPHIVQVIDQGKAGKAERIDGVSGMDTPLQIIDARDPLIVVLGQAIANEEGWNKPGSLARRLHNPGMLVWAGQVGASFIGSSPYAAFETDDAGWAALYADLRLKKTTGKVDCESIHREYGHNMSVDECQVWEIAYNWSQGNPEKYARDVVADLKARGLLK